MSEPSDWLCLLPMGLIAAAMLTAAFGRFLVRLELEERRIMAEASVAPHACDGMERLASAVNRAGCTARDTYRAPPADTTIRVFVDGVEYEGRATLTRTGGMVHYQRVVDSPRGDGRNV